MSAEDEEMTYGSVPASSARAPTLRRKATVSAILAMATATVVGFLALTRVSQRLTLGGYSGDDANQHVLDNICPIYRAHGRSRRQGRHDVPYSQGVVNLHEAPAHCGIQA